MKPKKTVIAVAGVVSSVIGTVYAIPSILQNRYTAAGIFTVLIVAGIVLIAISLGD